MLTRDIWRTLATRISVFAVGAAGSIILTRSLGPEGRGYYLGAISIVLLGIQLGTLGLGSSNTYYLNSSKEDGRELTANTLVLGLGIGIVLAIVGWSRGATRRGSGRERGYAGDDRGARHDPVRHLVAARPEPAHREGRRLHVQPRRSISQPRLMALVLVRLPSACTGGTRRRDLALHDRVLGPGGMVVVWPPAGRPRSRTPARAGTAGVFRRTIGYGLKAYAVTFFGYLVLRVDALLVQNWRGAVDAGQYGVAVQLGDHLLTVSSTVAMITFPRAAESGADAWPMIRRTTLATGAALTGLAIIAYALAPWGIPLVFGEAFTPAVSSFRILLPGIWFLSIETLLVQYLNGLGMPIVILWGWVGALGVNVAVNTVVIPRMGIDGAAWASTLAYALMAFLVAGLVVRDRRARTRGK